jgi:integrase
MANTWSAIRSFWGWYDSEFHTGQPDLKLARPRAQVEVVEPFTEDEVRALISAAQAFDIHPKTDRQKPYKTRRKTSDRDVSIILTLLDTGVRVGELCRLKVRDVDLTSGEITVVALAGGWEVTRRDVL